MLLRQLTTPSTPSHVSHLDKTESVREATSTFQVDKTPSGETLTLSHGSEVSEGLEGIAEEELLEGSEAIESLLDAVEKISLEESMGTSLIGVYCLTA